MSSRKREQRRGRRARRAAVLEAPTMRPITYNLPVYELLDEGGLERLHLASMHILTELGIDFYDEEIRAILKSHGADVRGDTVYFDPALIEEYVALAPGRFTQLARNPEHNLVIGGDK
ncbi:MAG: trimethylamine methyltransferase family protein, partial [Anaerolineae bacterium]